MNSDLAEGAYTSQASPSTVNILCHRSFLKVCVLPRRTCRTTTWVQARRCSTDRCPHCAYSPIVPQLLVCTQARSESVPGYFRPYLQRGICFVDDRYRGATVCFHRRDGFQCTKALYAVRSTRQIARAGNLLRSWLGFCTFPQCLFRPNGLLLGHCPQIDWHSGHYFLNTPR